MSIDVKLKNKPKILGLDISTKTIGWALFDMTGSKLLELTHFSPKIKPQPEDKIEELILKAEAFKKHLLGYKDIPELSGGEVSFRNNLAILSNSRGEIFDFIGQRGQFGIDGSEYTEKLYKLDNKFLKENFGNYFKFC